MPTVRGSKAMVTPVPKIPFEDTPTQLDKITPKGMKPKIDLSLTDESPLAQAIVVISAIKEI